MKHIHRSLFAIFFLTASLCAAPAPARPSDGYPAEAQRLGLEGTSRFRAMIGTDGRAKTCEITQSSGHEILDTATCTKVIDHGRFDPARDVSGKKVNGYYESSISWKLD